MATVGKALRQALETYGISQIQLARTMGIKPTALHNWISENRMPSADKVIKIRDALQSIEPQAAEEFIRLYLEG